MHYLAEAIIVGLAVMIVGMMISPFLPTMESTLLVSGVLVHVLCELSGVNKAYCEVGYACQERNLIKNN